MITNHVPAGTMAVPAVTMTTPSAKPSRARRLLTLPGLVGIGYSLSWIAGLSVPAPSPKFSASGAQIRAARSRVALSRLMLVAGTVAAAISFLQFVMGMTLATTTHPASAHLLYGGIDRMDGLKMLTLAVLGMAAARAAALPGWLRYTGAALAVALTASGIVYLLLLQSLAVAAGPALVLLLVFITGSGLVPGMKER
jgi:hypothetical protein